MSLLEQHTALYTPLDIEYAQAMSGPYEDLSYRGADAVVIAGQKNGQVTGFWRPMVAFGDEHTLKLQIEGLWTEFQDFVYEDYLPDGRLSVASQFLLRRGYRAQSHYVQVLDLAESELRQGLRKSYRSLVNKQADVWACTVADVRAIHLKCRGVTRLDPSWRIQEKMPTVCCADGERAAVMFYCGSVWAYYACAAGENGHACLWAALLELKTRGVQFVEMGEQVFRGDEKLVNISKYKRGFGGRTKVRLILRKG